MKRIKLEIEMSITYVTLVQKNFRCAHYHFVLRIICTATHATFRQAMGIKRKILR